MVDLYNPRTDNWATYFWWDDYEIMGKTEIGIATISELFLHRIEVNLWDGECLFAT